MEELWEGEWNADIDAGHPEAFGAKVAFAFVCFVVIEIEETVKPPSGEGAKENKELAARSIATHGVIVVADAADRGTEVAAFGAEEFSLWRLAQGV